MNYDISIIIPCRDDDLKIFNETLNSIKLQSLQPSEIVIIDSSESNDLQEFIKSYELNGLINYFRIKPSFAGRSTNFGIEKAQYNLIALLDTKTAPKKYWLCDYLNIIKKENIDVVFGSTVFSYTTSFQRAVRAASYGAISHETVPGSMFFKQIGLKTKFKENVRAAYDIDWREKVKEDFSWYTPSKHFIVYAQFPNSIVSLIKKYFIYSFYTGLISSQKRLKDTYFALMLALTALLIPRWNLMLEGWDQNDLYIPDITKKYFLSLATIFLIISLGSLIIKSNLNSSLGYKTLKFLIYIFTFYSVFRWNAEIALWAEDAALYIPHITKIFILCVLSSSIIIRGIIKPIQKKEGFKYIFPYRWLFVGILGMIMDLAKAPGFIFGSIRGRAIGFRSR